MDRTKNSHIYVLLYFSLVNSKTNPHVLITMTFKKFI